jgi:MurNAc alpha-1-phosphate uridylyltransferase
VRDHGAEQAPALLLAAGRGERMRPLTDTTPKPLLPVHGQPLLAWHLQALARAGVPRVVINTAWLGEQIGQYFGRFFGLQRNTGKYKQLSILYSNEGRDFGGCAGNCRRQRAPCAAGRRRLLAGGGRCFMPGFAFDAVAVRAFRTSGALARLWLVPNPSQHPRGDFGLSDTGLALSLPEGDPRPRYTYSTVALLHRDLFAPPWCDIAPGNPQGVRAALAPLLRRAMDNGRVQAELHTGRWVDVGTPQRLADLNAETFSP